MNARFAMWGGVVLLFCASCLSASTEKEIGELIASMEKSDYAGRDALRKLVRIGKPAVEQLLAALEHKTARVRYWSAAALAQIGDERCVKPLMQLVKTDKHGLVRATALYYLRLFNDKEAWELIIATLDSPDAGMRGWAIRACREKNRVDALPKLKALARKSDNYKTRYDAMVAAVTIAEKDATEFVRGILKTDASVDVRIGAMKCLTVCKEKRPEMLTVMIDGLADRHPKVRTAAAALLRRGTNQEFPFDPDGDREDRAVAVANWRRWYEKHKDHLTWDDAKRRFEIREKRK